MGASLLSDASLNGGNLFFSHHRFPFFSLHASILSGWWFFLFVFFFFLFLVLLLETSPASLSFVSMLLLKDNAQLRGLGGGAALLVLVIQAKIDSLDWSVRRVLRLLGNF